MQIIVKNLRFEAVIGILPEERLTPQVLVVHAKIDYIYTPEYFLNYADLAFFLERTVQEERYYLIETALADLSQKLFDSYDKIEKIKLTILKPSILPNATVGLTHKTKRQKN